VAYFCIFGGGLVIGILLAARRRRVEVEQLKRQARAYRLQAVALKDLCHRLEQVGQISLPRRQPPLYSHDTHAVYQPLAKRA
jgi:hypothetical protein